MVLFEPGKIFMNPVSGRVYHPGPEVSGGVGLIHTKLSIELSNSFIFDNGQSSPPTDIMWRGDRIPLTYELGGTLESLNHLRKFSLGDDIG